MGEEDLRFLSPEQLAADVARIKQDYDRFRTISDLQYEFMEEFEEPAADVFKVTYADGSVLIFNLSGTEYLCNGKVCAPCSLVRL